MERHLHSRPYTLQYAIISDIPLLKANPCLRGEAITLPLFREVPEECAPVGGSKEVLSLQICGYTAVLWDHTAVYMANSG